MITLRRSGDRHHIRRRKRDVWLTFDAQDPQDPLAAGFGALETLNEGRLAPGADGPPETCHEAEVVTYVLRGAIVHHDSTGISGVLHAGEFQRRIGAPGVRRSEGNASRTDWAHVFHMWLRCEVMAMERQHDQQHFSAADRRGLLRVVASSDGRSGSMRLHGDVRIYSAMLDPGQHLIHELPARHSAWLHLLRGEAVLGDVVLSAGDGVGATGERAVSLTARADSEIFLVDLGPARPAPRECELTP